MSCPLPIVYNSPHAPSNSPHRRGHRLLRRRDPRAAPGLFPFGRHQRRVEAGTACRVRAPRDGWAGNPAGPAGPHQPAPRFPAGLTDRQRAVHPLPRLGRLQGLPTLPVH